MQMPVLYNAEFVCLGVPIDIYLLYYSMYRVRQQSYSSGFKLKSLCVI